MRILKYIASASALLFLSACSDEPDVGNSPYPATELIADSPVFTGHIIEVIEEDQVMMVVEGITKEEALEIDYQSYELPMATFFSNGTRFEEGFKAGDKVAVWKFEEGPELAGVIAERIVLLEE